MVIFSWIKMAKRAVVVRKIYLVTKRLANRVKSGVKYTKMSANYGV